MTGAVEKTDCDSKPKEAKPVLFYDAA